LILDYISHKHFLNAHDKYNDGDYDYYSIYMEEINYSTFIAPTVEENLIFAMDGDEKFIPLFTDMDEYKKMFGSDENISPKWHDFDHYLESGMQLTVNPLTEHIEIDLMGFIGKPKTPYFPMNFTQRTYGMSDLRLFADKFTNRDLAEFLNDPSAVHEDRILFKKMANSILFSPCILKSPEEIVDLKGIESQLILTKNNYLELFTSKDKIKKEHYTHMQVVNLRNIIEAIIRCDYNGILIDSDNYVDRNSLLLNFDDFKENYDDDKYAKAEDWAFKL